MDCPTRISHFIAGIILFSCLAMPANAITMAQVGSVDNFLGSVTLSNSGSSTEESWVSSIVGYAAQIDYRGSYNISSGWELVDGPEGYWAHSLVTNPAYYLLKLGVGKSGADTHYLFENLVELNWAVIDFSQMLAGQQELRFNFGRISHLSEFDGTDKPPTDLSEPGSLALLMIGFGLLGLIIARKSRAR